MSVERAPATQPPAPGSRLSLALWHSLRLRIALRFCSQSVAQQVNEKVEAASPKGLEEAPTAPGSPALIEPTERRPEELRGADLRGQDLTQIERLLPEHLAGADLTGAKLPDEIAKFPTLEQVEAISSEARKIFIGMLAACVYSWLVIGTTKDVQLIVNTATSPLPIINTPIPIAGFYIVGAALLAAVYCYLHFYLQRLWRTLATLPAVFLDGVALDDKTDPWLLTNLVRADFKRLRRNAPPLTRMENVLTILLAYWLVPLTLLALWARYIPAHYWLGTTCLVALTGITALFGRHSYRLARATLRGEIPTTEAEGDDARGVLRRAWHEFRQIRPDRLTVGLILVLIVGSLSAFHDNPRDRYTWVAKGLNAVGVRTYVDLREVNVAERPDGWNGEDWREIKRVDLRGRNLAFADARRAFLADADLRGANLREAILVEAELQGVALYVDDGNPYLLGRMYDHDPEYRHDYDPENAAQLQGANLTEAQLEGADLALAELQDADLTATHLQGASLSHARLQGAKLFLAQLQGADLANAQLQGADLADAQLQGANLLGAQLQGADLQALSFRAPTSSGAQLQGADLSGAKLQGADLLFAQLQGARLWAAELQGADLSTVNFQGADLRGAWLWRASRVPLQVVSTDGTRSPGETLWELADLSGISVEPLEDFEIDTLISEATKTIPDEARRKQTMSTLTTALRTGDNPARPYFSVEWQSRPNVMFQFGDPAPEPFSWGQRKWVTEVAYDRDLAEFLVALACRRDETPGLSIGHDAQTQGLALRAIQAEPGRVWPALFAKKITGRDCPPAKGLPDDVRHQLEELAAQPNAAAAPPQAPSPDPVE